MEVLATLGCEFVEYNLRINRNRSKWRETTTEHCTPFEPCRIGVCADLPQEHSRHHSFIGWRNQFAVSLAFFLSCSDSASLSGT